LSFIPPSRSVYPQTLPPKGSAHGNGLGRYFVADAVEAAAPAVANITVNIKFHAGRWMPTYATQSGTISSDSMHAGEKEGGREGGREEGRKGRGKDS